MTYLLDTNACIELLNERDTTIAQKLALIEPREILVCSVVKAELYHGAYKSQQRDANLLVLQRFFERFDSLPFDDAAAEEYGRLRAFLAKQGLLIGPNDLLIAAIALANNVTLVTHNTGEFERVPDLQMQDWQA
ncbi:MAG: type II toxin-antitoxin system VapC family toxin [Anaerolineales bacterium]